MATKAKPAAAPKPAGDSSVKKALKILASNVQFATEEQAEEFAKLVK